MLNILNELYDSKKMASIYTSRQDVNKFYFGNVLALNEKEIAIQMLSLDGDYDGVIVENVDNIIRVDVAGQYVEKMEKLCSRNDIYNFNEEIDNNNILKSVLMISIKKVEVVSIELNYSGYSDIVGIVESIEDGECKIKLIDEYGCEDGLSYVLISDVTQVSTESQDEKRIMKLWQFNK